MYTKRLILAMMNLIRAVFYFDSIPEEEFEYTWVSVIWGIAVFGLIFWYVLVW